MSKTKVATFPRKSKVLPISDYTLPPLKRLVISGYCRGSLSAEFVAEQFDLFGSGEV